MTQSPERTGAIYDIGYRSYSGPRLGRRAALETLFSQGVRAAFGFGRRPLSKVFPWLFAALALIPAAVYLGIAAIVPADIDLIETSDYLQFIFIILILFVAAVAPELVGRDIRFRTLALYFTRPVERDDYAMARLAALTAATLAITVVPQMTLVIGNSLASDSVWEYAKEEWAEVPRVIFSGLVVAVYVSSISIAIACHTHRRSFAIGGIVGFFIISGAIGGILGEVLAGEFILLDPATQLESATLLIFNKDPDPLEPLATEGIPLSAGVLFLVGYLAAAIAMTVRRYRKVSA